MVGKKIAELCLQKNIEKVCFDRGGNIYHGRVQVRQLCFIGTQYMSTNSYTMVFRLTPENRTSVRGRMK